MVLWGVCLNFVVGLDIWMDSMITDATTEARARARGELWMWD